MSLIMNRLTLKARVLAREIHLLRSQIKEVEACLGFRRSQLLQENASQKRAMLVQKELELATLNATMTHLSSAV